MGKFLEVTVVDDGDDPFDPVVRDFVIRESIEHQRFEIVPQGGREPIAFVDQREIVKSRWPAVLWEQELKFRAWLWAMGQKKTVTKK